MGEGADDQPRMGDDEAEAPGPEATQPGQGQERVRERETEEAPPAEPARPQPPVDQALARIGRSLGGRPLSVYGVLLAGAAVLLILLAIIWITAGDNGDDENVPCLNITLDQALARIEAAEVERVDVSYRGDNPRLLPAVLSLKTTDGGCHSLQPQGIEGQVAMLAVIGAVEYFNETSEERRITLSIDAGENIPADIFFTPTPIPTATVEPTPTVEPTATTEAASPTAVAPTETPGPTETPVLPASPEASPEGSPVEGSPVASDPPPTETPTA